MDSHTKIIDLSYLKEMSGNNKDIMVEMVEIFIEQNPEFTEGISSYFENKQWTELGAIAHKAKSSVRIMGMVELGDCLEKIEHYSKGNQKVELQQKIKNRHKLNDDDLRIGVDPPGGDEYWNGMLDEIKIWNETLSLSQILTSMRGSATPRARSLVGFWRFNEGTGTLANDRSRNHNDGNLNGGVAFMSPGAP